MIMPDRPDGVFDAPVRSGDLLEEAMKRLTSTLLAASLGLYFAPSHGQASPAILSLVFDSQIGNPQQIGAEALGKAIADRLGERLVIDLRGGGTGNLGSENAVLEAVGQGAVDIAVLTGPVVTPVVPEFGVFDVPFLFRDAAHVKLVAEGEIGRGIAAKFTARGLVLLAIGEQGFRHLTNAKHPIRTPGDLKGLKIRVLPNEIYKMTFQALGADVVPMEYSLVHAALKDGRIDGQENPFKTMVAAHMAEVQRYLSLSSHFFSPVAFVMNRDSFASLDPVDQAIVLESARSAAEATRALGARETAENLAVLTQAGMQVNEIDRDAFIKATAPLEPEFEKRFGKDLLAAIRAAR
jgi:tripartite ATP-independent transporter DctP family solute receptor